MEEELIGVLPQFVCLEDGVEDFLLGFLAAAFPDVLWVDDFGVNVARVIVENYNLVDAEDGCCARDSAYLDRLVVGLLGIERPATRQRDGDCPVSAFGGFEDGSRF
jgi:hypothetical protein